RHVDVGGIAVGGVECARQFPGQPTDRQRVPEIRRGSQFQHRVLESQDFTRVVAGTGRPRRQHEDSAVVLPDAQLSGRTDHALTDVAVGLALGDLEITGQHGAGERDDHEVARPDVVSTADDDVRGRARGIDLHTVEVGGGTHVDSAVADRLFELRELFDLHHTDDDERTGDPTDRLDALDLDAQAYKGVDDVVGGDVLAEF